MEQARAGLATQLETLHPQQHRVPAPRAGPAAARRGRAPAGHPDRGRARSSSWSAATTTTRELAALRPFLREQQPVLIGVGAGADAARARPASRPTSSCVDARRRRRRCPSADDAARAPRDVVVRADRGAHRGAPSSQLERLGVRPLRCRVRRRPPRTPRCCSPTPRDAALIVGVGMHATLDEFLDRQRPGLASTYLTRLKVGPRLVDATAVPHLYSGRVRPVAPAAGAARRPASPSPPPIAVTPVGQEWADDAAACSTDYLARTLLVISYRHHIVSLVAVFLALAVGIALGGGPLSDLGRDDRPAAGDHRTTRTADAADRRRSATTSRPPAAAHAVRRRPAPTTPVALVALPGADADDGQRARRAGRGGRRHGRRHATTCSRRSLDPAEKSLVDTLGSQLATQLGDRRVERRRADVRRGSGSCSASPCATGDPRRRRRRPRSRREPRRRRAADLADGRRAARRLVLVVARRPTTDPRDPRRAGRPAWPTKATGVVVAGDTASGAAGGDLAALRADPASPTAVATVDGARHARSAR